jgi:signal transduction histidine kinase
MKIRPRSPSKASSPAARPGTSPAPDGPPPRRWPGRLSAAALLLLATWLTFLIRYRDPVFPFLIVAVLATSLWRLRVGAVCLAAALVILALALLRDPPWRDGQDDLLMLALLGSVMLGARAVLDGFERQRVTEQRLIAELSETVGQLRESERQQARAAQALAERHRLLREILDSVDNGIFLMDPDGRVSFANERLGELLGLDAGKIIGRDAKEAVLCPLAARCRGGQVPEPAPLPDSRQEPSRSLLELRFPTPRLLCQYRAPVRDDTGRELGCLYVYSDLPDRERLQELLEARVSERTQELEAAQEQLLRSARLAALGQFSATMAHELRNPLNVVKLSAHYVTTRVSNPDERLQRSLSHMNRSMERACALINDMLAFSRLPPPQMSRAAINGIVREAIAALPVSDGVTVEWSLALGLPPVSIDVRQIEQAIANLGLNALQAMPDGGCVRVSTLRVGERVEIRISDSGPGVPDELAVRIFEPFFSTKATGTGLGLPLVREIALAHGGDLALQSAAGAGACFVLTLPVAPAMPRSEPSHLTAPPGP